MPSIQGICGQAIMSRIAGKICSPTSANLWRKYKPANNIYIRNTANVFNDVDLTCFPVGCSIWGFSGFGGAALISRWHMLSANHLVGKAKKWIGSSWRFVNKANKVITRTVASATRIDTGDIDVLTFDNPLPIGIKPAYVPAADWFPLFGNISPLYPVPGLGTDQFGNLICLDITYIIAAGTFFMQSNNPMRAGWYKQLSAGDSGYSGGVIVGNKFVLLTQWETPSSGPSDVAHIDEINAIMAKKSVALTRLSING